MTYIPPVKAPAATQQNVANQQPASFSGFADQRESTTAALQLQADIQSSTYHHQAQGLRQLMVNKEVSPAQRVVQLESASVRDSGHGPKLTGQSDKSKSTGINKTDVSYTKGKTTTTKEDVGIGMIAKSIGPDHPQGSEPSNFVTRQHIKGLGGADTYIRGHLLNGDLGGPGEAANLFPITAQANSQHYQKVEKAAKILINDQKCWARYQVLVTNRDDANGAADFECELAPLDGTGADTQWMLSGTIHSEPGNSSSNISQKSLGNKKTILSDNVNFKDDDIEYSEGKTPAGYKPIEQDVEERMLVDKNKKILGMSKVVWNLKELGIGEESAEEIELYVLTGDSAIFMNTHKSTWNKWVNLINAGYP